MPDTAVYKYWGAVSNKAGTKKATHRTLSTTMELMATSEAKDNKRIEHRHERIAELGERRCKQYEERLTPMLKEQPGVVP
jgi:hypothetical protein